MSLSLFMNQLDDSDLTLFERSQKFKNSNMDRGYWENQEEGHQIGMELRNMIVEKTREILSVGSIALSEEVALSFVTSIFNNTLNVEHAGEKKDLTNSPLLIDIGCNGALPL
ncbi:hypothetical protein TCAL_15280 [Tigriopus californicus]|uniref:Uncharacterized protein n=1 Tax=Tigriopus californicus TaxID=6832 RepID=A0A553PLZ3_TIGCA|nr:hypothetical protein TCAL_15280 [Tigriopus californicus]